MIKRIKEKIKYIEPTRRKKCPKCGSRDYSISAPIENYKEFKDGKLVGFKRGRYDAGSFNCKKCGYEDSY